LSLALVACGPSSTESGSLQSVGAPVPAAVAATTATESSPATPTSTVAAPATATLAVSVTGGSALAQVSTSSGAPAAGTVSFAVDGAAAGDVAVSGNQASVVIPAGLPVGDHTVTARFVSTDTAAVTGADGTATFAVAKAASSITASVGKDSIRYGDQASFDISVQASGAPAGADLTGHVTVLDGTETIEEGDTDAAGQLSLRFLNRADPGAKTYTVNYAGNAAVEATSAPLPVQTTQTNVDISVDWTDGLKPGDDATISVDIVGTPDSPTGSVTIAYEGTQIGAGPVDANGKISAVASAVTAGDHQIKVGYAGDARFEANTATATLTVKDPVANPNAAGAAAAQASNPCPAAASACVDLANEQAWLQSGGQITYGPVPITSGKSGARTRVGMFSVFWRDKNHKSSLFDDAPMPNSVFFDNDIAFHQGSLSRQSNGCIHLSWDASETFFDTLSVGDAVYVWGAAPY
jgi:methionine-rich copper-binding protein CopC